MLPVAAVLDGQSCPSESPASHSSGAVSVAYFPGRSKPGAHARCRSIFTCMLPVVPLSLSISGKHEFFFEPAGAIEPPSRITSCRRTAGLRYRLSSGRGAPARRCYWRPGSCSCMRAQARWRCVLRRARRRIWVVDGAGIRAMGLSAHGLELTELKDDISLCWPG
jgi:hypothetical protein